MEVVLFAILNASCYSYVKCYSKISITWYHGNKAPGEITSSFGWAPSLPCLFPLPGLPACTCMGTLPRWEPMRQYMVTEAVKFLSHVKELHRLTWEVMSTLKLVILTGYCHIGFATRKTFHAGAGRKTEQ